MMRRSSRVRLTLLPLLASAALAATPAAAQSAAPLVEVELPACEDGNDQCAQIDDQVTDANGDAVPQSSGGGYVSSGFGTYFWSAGG